MINARREIALQLLKEALSVQAVLHAVEAAGFKVDAPNLESSTLIMMINKVLKESSYINMQGDVENYAATLHDHERWCSHAVLLWKGNLKVSLQDFLDLTKVQLEQAFSEAESTPPEVSYSAFIERIEVHYDCSDLVTAKDLKRLIARVNECHGLSNYVGIQDWLDLEGMIKEIYAAPARFFEKLNQRLEGR